MFLSPCSVRRNLVWVLVKDGVENFQDSNKLFSDQRGHMTPIFIMKKESPDHKEPKTKQITHRPPP